MSKTGMTVDDVVGAWAIMPTPAVPGPVDWSTEQSVDHDEAARALEGLIAGDIDGILSLGTLGECATLTWEEKQAFIATLVETAQGRVPVFVGTTSLNTRDTVRQTRAAAALGADGIMLGLPMWCALTLEGAVQFYRDVAEACPKVPICVYANPQAFRFDFGRMFWRQVAEIEQVVAAKYIGIGNFLNDIEMTQRRVRLLPIDADYYAGARMAPEYCNAFWTSGAVCGPRVVTTLRDSVAAAKANGDWTQAKALSDAVNASLAPLFPNGSFEEFSRFNIGLEKARMDAAGWMRAGAPRPPYHKIPEPYLESARRSGRLWAEIETGLATEAPRHETALRSNSGLPL